MSNTIFKAKIQSTIIINAITNRRIEMLFEFHESSNDWLKIRMHDSIFTIFTWQILELVKSEYIYKISLAIERTKQATY